MTTLMSRFGRAQVDATSENAKCEIERPVLHPLVADPLVADLLLAIDITSSPIRCLHLILLNDNNIFAVLSQASRVVFPDVT
jgi:hypothetical protein